MLKEAVESSALMVRVLRVEDINGLKIQAYSNDLSRELQDKADVQSLIAKNPNLDWDRVRKYADLFEQWAEIERIRSRV